MGFEPPTSTYGVTGKLSLDGYPGVTPDNFAQKTNVQEVGHLSWWAVEGSNL
jgi:hypothetical protein